MKFGFKVATLATLLLIFAGARLHWLGNAHAASHSQITGTVKLEGVAPRQRTIDMASEPSCAASHKDKPVTAESVVVGPNGGLANVVLYVSQGLNRERSPFVCSGPDRAKRLSVPSACGCRRCGSAHEDTE